jgi:uncharacterized membrane protein
MSVINKSKQRHSAWHFRFWLIKFKKVVGIISGSFWFIPSILISLAAVAGVMLPTLPLPKFLTKVLDRLFVIVDLEDSLEVVKLIASSTITITSIAFSMTVVALVMASNQFGPRLIENFMQSKWTQSVLGIFTSTFVFCLVIISKINVGSDAAYYPQFVIVIAVLLAVICVFVLIFFIHHVANSIRADNVVKEISSSMMQYIRTLQGDRTRVHAFKSIVELENYTYKQSIVSKCDGYIQAIEFQQILNIAIQFDGIIVMQYRAGQYLVPGTPIAILYNNAVIPNSISLDSALVIGEERTSLQDTLFVINQLVEMALRALSPSMNDPFTVTNCIDRLASGMASFTKESLPKTAIVDYQSELRIITNAATFSDLFKGAFNQIRQNSVDHTFVIMHLLVTFITLLKACDCKAYMCDAVGTQVKSIKQYHEQNSIFDNEEDIAQFDKHIAELELLMKKSEC